METLRSLRAIVWLRWRLLKNSIGGSRKRDALEQVSRSLAVVVPILVASLSIGTFVAISIVGFLGGRAIASGLLDAPTGVLILRVLVAITMVAVISIAAVSPIQSSTTRYTRLLLLPIHRRVLHLVEVGATLADPWIAVIAAGLISFAVGILAGGRPAAALAALGAAAATVVVLVCAASLVSFLVAWLMRNRRRSELFTLMFVLGFSLLSFLPAFASRFEDRRGDEGSGQHRPPIDVRAIDRELPMWSRYVPSEMHGRIVTAALAGRDVRAAAGVATLLVQAALLFFLSSRVHARMLNSLEGDSGRRRSSGIGGLSRKLPFLTAAASAVAWAQYKGALRTVRGRLTILLPGPMLGILTLAFRGLPDETWATSAADQGYLLLAVTILFTLYSMHAVSMNFFGSDRAGLTLQLLSPLTDRDLAWGKIAGFGMIASTGLVICLATSLAVARSGPPAYWIAAIIGGGATFLLLCPVAIWFSALFPVASDLSKTGSGGNPHPLPMIVGTICTALFAMPAALVVIAAEFSFQSEIAAVPLMLAWLGITAAISIPLVNLASRTIGHRRENLAMVAQGR